MYFKDFVSNKFFNKTNTVLNNRSRYGLIVQDDWFSLEEILSDIILKRFKTLENIEYIKANTIILINSRFKKSRNGEYFLNLAGVNQLVNLFLKVQ